MIVISNRLLTYKAFAIIPFMIAFILILLHFIFYNGGFPYLLCVVGLAIIVGFLILWKFENTSTLEYFPEEGHVVFRRGTKLTTISLTEIELFKKELDYRGRQSIIGNPGFSVYLMVYFHKGMYQERSFAIWADQAELLSNYNQLRKATYTIRKSRL